MTKGRTPKSPASVLTVNTTYKTPKFKPQALSCQQLAYEFIEYTLPFGLLGQQQKAVSFFPAMLQITNAFHNERRYLFPNESV